MPVGSHPPQTLSVLLCELAGGFILAFALWKPTVVICKSCGLEIKMTVHVQPLSCVLALLGQIWICTITYSTYDSGKHNINREMWASIQSGAMQHQREPGRWKRGGDRHPIMALVDWDLTPVVSSDQFNFSPNARFWTEREPPHRQWKHANSIQKSCLHF